MAVEIERKFLVQPGLWTPRTAGDHIRQGYILSSPERTVRVRIREGRGYLTIKGPTTGCSRLEFEYPIPVTDAHELLDQLCPAVVDKHRYLEPLGAHMWEVDIFHEANDGLVIAEVELQSEQDVLELPVWVGPEVTADFRYSNAYLSHHPFSTWSL